MGYSTSFGKGTWLIKKGNLVILRGQKHGTLYSMHVSHVHEDSISIAEHLNTDLWHNRLGHMSKKRMQQLEHTRYLPPLSLSDFQICEHCIYGKQIRKTSPSSDRKRLLPLELVHSDVCGPMPNKSRGGSSYFVTFIDDSTRKGWFYGLQSKDQVFSTY